MTTDGLVSAVVTHFSGKSKPPASWQQTHLLRVALRVGLVPLCNGMFTTDQVKHATMGGGVVARLQPSFRAHQNCLYLRQMSTQSLKPDGTFFNIN